MSNARKCPRCGAELESSSAEGLCPRCLLQDAFEPTPEAERLVSVPEPAPGTRIRYFGDYELLQELGHGGMGVVYQARQVSLNRLVAVKLIQGGEFASPQFIQRFRTEAEAAARLQHPNIVAIHEVGAHHGQHYFSMDYVEGPTLEEQVRKGPLPPQRAAALVQRMAEAIHYAHGQGILHRDLKPSNVLVDRLDQPRITDFGLAKVLTGDSELTLSGQPLGSPGYMAPEQATGKPGEVGPPSDVYGLGAVLYHLLTGRAPFHAETLTEVLRQVRETEPVRPRGLNPSVPRDLETICLKCLEKEPPRRYRTAQDLAEELGRFVAGRPILARPVSRPERLWRWSRRQPVQASLVAALLAVVVLGFSGVIWQWRQAEAGRQEARTEAAKSQQVAEFLKDMLVGVGPGVAQGRDTTLLREILNKTAKRVAKDLTNQPEVQVEVLLTLGSTYMELGEFTNAVDLAREGVRLRTAPGETNALVADSLYVLASVLARRGTPADLTEAESLLRQALPLQRRFRGDKHKSVAESMVLLAGTLRRSGRELAEAEALYLEVLKLRRELYGNEHPDVAGTLINFALVLRDRGKLTEAETNLHEAMNIEKKLPGTQRPGLATALLNLATVLQRQGKLTNAESAFREALEKRRMLHGVTNVYTQEVVKGLTACLRQQGKNVELEALRREELDLRIKACGNKHREVQRALVALDEELQRQGKLAEAEDISRRELELEKELSGGRHPSVAFAYNRLGWILERRSKLAEAEGAYRKALEIRREQPDSERNEVVEALIRLGAVLKKQSKLADAEDAYRRALAIDRHSLSPDNLIRLAGVLKDQGKLPEAEQLCREAVAICRKQGKEDWALDNSLDALAEVLWAAEKFSEALEVKREKLAVAKKLSREALDPVIYSLWSLADMLGHQGNLTEAKEKIHEALQLRLKQVERAPTNNVDVSRRYAAALYQHALLCVGTGDTNGYRATAAQIIAHLERRVPGLTVSLGWACSLAPDAVTNYAPLFEVVTGALAGQTNITKNLYGFQALGALLYRARRYPEAARQLTETFQLSQAGDTNTTTTLTACGAYFLTLTHAQLGHTNEAIACFQRASRLDSSTRGTGGRGVADIPPWDERLNLQLLRKEAESVLNARTSPPTSPP